MAKQTVDDAVRELIWGWSQEAGVTQEDLRRAAGGWQYQTSVSGYLHRGAGATLEQLVRMTEFLGHKPIEWFAEAELEPEAQEVLAIFRRANPRRRQTILEVLVALDDPTERSSAPSNHPSRKRVNR